MSRKIEEFEVKKSFPSFEQGSEMASPSVPSVPEVSGSGFAIQLSQSSPTLDSSTPLVFAKTSKSLITLRPAVLSCWSLQKSPRSRSQTDEGKGVVGRNSDLKTSSFSGRISNENVNYLSSTPSLVQDNSSALPKEMASLGISSGSSFVLRNRTNLPNGLPNNTLVQTLLRENQKIRAEYQQYKRESQAKLLGMQDTILKLKESVNINQKKMLELKLQKEVYVARETHAFQEIQNDMKSLQQKVAVFAQVESLKADGRPRGDPPKLIPISQQTQSARNEGANLGVCYRELVEKLSSMESRIVFLEASSQGVSTSCKVIEENLKVHMSNTDGKLNQIIHAIMGNKQDAPLPQQETHVQERDNDADASPYNASAEDSQDTDTCLDLEGSPSNGMKTKEMSLETRTQDDGVVYDLDTTMPVEIVLKSGVEQASSSSFKGHLMRHQNSSKRQLDFGCNKSLRKRSCRRRWRARETPYPQQHSEIESDEDDRPPVLQLPSRIAKRALCRPESMPILLPEVDMMQYRIQQSSNSQPEARDVDALIGIKRGNGFGVLHGKDLSKPGFVCLCGSKFTGAGGLYVHQVKSTETEKFACHVCKKKFHYFSGLKAHRKSAHKQEFTQEVGCSRCGQIFKSKKDRQGHLDERGQTCWLSGSYQSKDWEIIRHKRNLSGSSYSYYPSLSSQTSHQN